MFPDSKWCKSLSLLKSKILFILRNGSGPLYKYWSVKVSLVQVVLFTIIFDETTT